MSSRSPVALFCALLTLAILAPSAHAQVPSLVYAQAHGSDRIEHAYATTTDYADNVLVIGSTTGAVDMGGGPLAYATNNGALALAKYTPTGAHLWSVAIGGGSTTGSPFCTDMKTDAAGDVYICGRIIGTLDIGGGILGTTGSSGDAFVAKYSGLDGSHIWSQSFGDADLDQGLGLAVDPSGNVVLVGRFRGTIDFGGGLFTASASGDLYVAKFNSAGTHLWSQAYPDASNPYLESVTTDGAGNIIFGGAFFASIDFGGGPLTPTVGSAAFLVKLDPNGNHIWSETFPSTDYTGILAVEADAAGNVAFGGEFRDSVTFGGFPLTSLGDKDAFVGRCDPSGNVQWAYSIGSDGTSSGSASDRITEVRLDPSDGNAVLASGYFYDSAQVGGGPPMTGTTTDLSVFVVKYNAGGGHQWNKVVADGSIAHLAVDSFGDFYLFSEFFSSVTVDTAPLTGVGLTDFYLAKFTEDQPVPVVFQSFEAAPSEAGIDVVWTFGDVATLDRYSLYRSQGSRDGRVVSSGPVQHDGIYRDFEVDAGLNYDYELRVLTKDGFELRSQVSGAIAPRIPVSLSQNSPNPFNPRTTIRFSLASRSRVLIAIYDVSGALVRRLDAGEQAPGSHQIEWDGTDASGRPVASGNYYYRLAGSPEVRGRKMTLVK